MRCTVMVVAKEPPVLVGHGNLMTVLCLKSGTRSKLEGCVACCAAIEAGKMRH